ncbi:MAG: ATP-grasp domain-containing protein [Candidatus Magasanikbacteria bacterium]|nr:ATP-grasp domain-containing protein [Candidatus Magasanikbacteria bacterium]
MPALENRLKFTPLVYVTRDLERALGLPLKTKNYYLVTNATPFAKATAAAAARVLLIKAKEPLDTRELLQHPPTINFIKKMKRQPAILVFKNTPQIERICAARGWRLLNPSAELANRVEEKISQLEWLGPLKKYLPPHQVMLGKDLAWQNKKFILQFNRAHTGLGTMLIESARQIQELKKKFPRREVRVTKFISGPIFTVNSVVWGNRVLVGNISYQITGLAPFTDQPFATIGNDWALANQALSYQQGKQIKQIQRIAIDIGKRLRDDGWRGLFGIDVVVEETTGRVYLLEINARQPASAAYESQLQARNKGSSSKYKVSTFEAHLAALLGLPLARPALIPITAGAQIIQRVIRSASPLPASRFALTKLSHAGFTIIPYANPRPGADRLRIQSKQGIMKGHNELNTAGKGIASSRSLH